MNKSESIINLVQATIKVMAEVKGIDKTMTIGSGENSYKGVSDQEVKKIIGSSMEKNGLTIFPIGIEETTNVDIYDDQWKKRKQNIFTKVITKYLLCHTSGEYIEITGYGHGVDSQDKSAGKATTYALKYVLLYTFLIPTGKIDDADNTHSDDAPPPPPIAPPPPPIQPIQTPPVEVAIEEIKKSKTLNEVALCWKKWNVYQKDTSFLAAKEEMKLKLAPVLSEELDKLLTQSILTFETVDTMEKATAIWNSTPELQTNKNFVSAFNDAKKRLTNIN